MAKSPAHIVAWTNSTNDMLHFQIPGSMRTNMINIMLIVMKGARATSLKDF